MIRILLAAVVLMSAASQASTLPDKPRSLEAALEAIRPQVEKTFGKQVLAEATDGAALTLIALKEERIVEVWKKRVSGQEKILTLRFTAFSGELGPKLREGDRQIPEGIYRVTTLNPNSSYHLSFQINYPNASERKHAKAEGRNYPGSLIFFHGDKKSIGCIPVGDAGIEILFTLVALNQPENCQVIIAPRDFRKGLPTPEIKGVAWSEALYTQLRKSLQPFKEVASE